MTDTTDNVTFAAEITAAWLANPNTRATTHDVPAFLKATFEAVSSLATPTAPVSEEAPATEYTPAVSVRKSLASPDHIISMIDGKPYKTLRRHLAINGLTPDDYRQRYGLKSDYPMVAATYSEARRTMAKNIGLGRKAGTNKATEPQADVPAGDAMPKKGRRKSGTEALNASRTRFDGDQQ